MKALFGIVSLLVVVAVVGVLASRQTRTLAAGPATGASAVTVPQASRQLQDQVQKDLDQAAAQSARRLDNAEQ